MEDGLQPGQRLRIVEDAGAERAAVDMALTDGAGKGGLDFRHRLAARPEQPMHRGIPLMHGDAHAAQQAGGGGLAHTDRAGEADHFHGANPATTARRRSSVTSGSTPNQAAKPGTAWCSSMPSPSTGARPRPRAAASRVVSSGA